MKNDLIDQYIPYRGKCAICGSDDARHRIFDMIYGFYTVNENMEDIAAEYGYPVEVIEEIIRTYSELSTLSL